MRGFHHLRPWRLRRAEVRRSRHRVDVRAGHARDAPPRDASVGSAGDDEDLRRAVRRAPDRQRERPAGSGTVAALDAGVHAQGKKVVEEAAEVWMAAEHESAERTAEEISQLLYRVQVIMLGKGIGLEDVYRHL